MATASDAAFTLDSLGRDIRYARASSSAPQDSLQPR